MVTPPCACIYLGNSLYHAGSVAMVLNTATGHVSPQFHVIFDDEFTQFHSLGKAQYPQIVKTLCNAYNKEAHQIIFAPSKLVSLQILSKIPDKTKVTSQ